MKIHVLMVSRVFPAYHPLRGTPTDFHSKITNQEKIHTIRYNYSFWEPRINEVASGKALLSIREWSGKPYNSAQAELFALDKESGIGIQKIDLSQVVPPKKALTTLNADGKFELLIDLAKMPNDWSVDRLATISKNDGLTPSEFIKWFQEVPSAPMALIHFTDFRY